MNLTQEKDRHIVSETEPAHLMKAHRQGARRRSDAAMQGISRDERPKRVSDAGWRVRLYKGGKYVANRHFRDEAYHGSDRALAAAKRFRDDMAKEYGVPQQKKRSSVLVDIRIKAGLTQKELAGWLHVSLSLIARWELLGAPLPVLKLVSAMIAGIVVPSATMPRPSLEKVRHDLGLYQEEMAMKFGRTYNAYGQWERGIHRMPGWVNVYVDAISKGWDEKSVNLPMEKFLSSSDL